MARSARRIPVRSDRYQWVLLESSYSHDMLESFSNQESISKRLNPYKYNDEAEELKDQLCECFRRIIKEHLTSRQREVIELYTIEELTQQEIAKKLGVNQSSITKSLNGNVDYKNGKRVYGGTKRKIEKIIETDPEVQKILARLHEIQEEEW